MEQWKFLVGVMVSKDSGLDGKYLFKYSGSNIESDNNILYVMTEKELSDEELLSRFNGTSGFEKIIRK
jgi:hypothetical protein